MDILYCISQRQRSSSRLARDQCTPTHTDNADGHSSNYEQQLLFHHETPAAIFAAILRGDIHWDAFNEGIAASASADDDTIEAGVDAARSLITRLLHPLPELRLGGTAVQAHRFFAGLNWRAIYDAPPPFRPKLEHDEDTSYFADRRRHGLPFAHEWQEMLAADAPWLDCTARMATRWHRVGGDAYALLRTLSLRGPGRSALPCHAMRRWRCG